MSFYITLPSNSSIDTFPDNTLTSFTTKLKTAIKLEGNYEVALTEIMYPMNWKFRRDGKIIFKKDDTNKYIFDVKFYAYETPNELFNHLNGYLSTKKIPIVFNITKATSKLQLLLPPPWIIEFTDHLHIELGLLYKVIQGIPNAEIHHAMFKLPISLNPINALYVYCDIVEHQCVGDSLVPLLRVVGVDQKYSFSEYVVKIYNTPNYVPVCRNYIETIRIDIKDDTGEKIHFNPGKVLIKLHFKPYNGL